MAIDSRDNMFFGLMNDIAVASWNINTPYQRSNFKLVAQNPVTLQFISGLKIKRSRINTEELWVMSNRFQVNYNTLNALRIYIHIYLNPAEISCWDEKFTRNQLPDFRM